MDEQRMLEQVKEFFRSLLALQIETVRGDIRAAEAKTDAVGTKVEAYRRELVAEFHRLEDKVDVHLQAIQQILDARLGSMDTKFGAVDTRLGAMDKRFDGMDKRLDGIDKRFDAIDKRFDAMDNRLEGMDQKLGLMDQKLDLFRKELLAEIRAVIR
jgi:flagellar capping protein FliD